VKTASPEKTERDSFIPISPLTIVPSTIVGVSLYILEEKTGKYKLYRAADYPIEDVDLKRLPDKGIDRIYVNNRDKQRYQRYLQENITQVLTNESIKPGDRFQLLNNVMRGMLQDSFSKKNRQTTVKKTRQMGNQIVDLICRQDLSKQDLFSVLYHDYNTFTHSANVSYYSVLLAKSLGINDSKTLQQIATGAFLHDIGKLEIPNSILNCPGPLDEKAIAQIKEHPKIGFLKLCDRKDVSFGELMVVYQHHERKNGRGYPVGLVGNEIHEWARICMIVDIFDALTSNRPYRDGMDLGVALSVIERQSDGLEEEFYKCWKAIITKL